MKLTQRTRSILNRISTFPQTAGPLVRELRTTEIRAALDVIRGGPAHALLSAELLRRRGRIERRPWRFK